MAASEKPEKTAYVYMVRCAGGQLYTGWTNDPEARLKAHQSGKGAKYTRTHTALGFAYLEACADKSAALRREIALKKLTKAQKEALCAGWTAVCFADFRDFRKFLKKSEIFSAINRGSARFSLT